MNYTYCDIKRKIRYKVYCTRHDTKLIARIIQLARGRCNMKRLSENVEYNFGLRFRVSHARRFILVLVQFAA